MRLGKIFSSAHLLNNVFRGNWMDHPGRVDDCVCLSNTGQSANARAVIIFHLYLTVST